ncbi:MAG: hypothetical protein VXY53_04770 [Candidatus Thermoplasmatota archaeon]|nr:hypothetical protein [Candidatus Thermoplasmatota archaeon]
MPEYVIEWSLTRRKIFTNCARRFTLKYLNNSKQTKESVRRKWHSNWDLMIASTREVFFDWLKDLHRNVIWTDKVIYSNIRFKIITNLYKNGSKNKQTSNISKNRLFTNGYSRLKTLMRHNVIKKIAGGQIKEWSFHERTNSISFGHLDVYCSPDIVFRQGKEWHLVRLNFQSEHNQPYLDLELTSMLLWSKGNQYLPNLEDKFVIYGIYFHNGKWHEKRFKPTQKILQETKQLLEKDVHHMNLLFTHFYRTKDIDALSLAKSKNYCKRCPYKTNCPINT